MDIEIDRGASVVWLDRQVELAKVVAIAGDEVIGEASNLRSGVSRGLSAQQKIGGNSGYLRVANFKASLILAPETLDARALFASLLRIFAPRSAHKESTHCV